MEELSEDEKARVDGWRDAEHRRLFLEATHRLSFTIEELAKAIEEHCMVRERKMKSSKKQRHASEKFQRFMRRCRTMWRRPTK